MQGLRGIADIDCARFDAGWTHAERKRLHRSTRDRDRTARPAACGCGKRRKKVAFRRLGQLARALRARAPHNGIAALQRQQGKRTFRRKALECAGACRGLGLHQGDERLLPVGRFLRICRRTFGVHRAPCFRWFLRSEEGRSLRAQSGSEHGIVNHVPQMRHASVLGVHAGAAKTAGLRDEDGFDRRDGEIAPDADALEDQAARIGQRDRAKAWSGRLSFQDLDPEIRIGQGKRERAANRPATLDQDVRHGRGHRASALRYRRPPWAPRQ